MKIARTCSHLSVLLALALPWSWVSAQGTGGSHIVVSSLAGGYLPGPIGCNGQGFQIDGTSALVQGKLSQGVPFRWPSLPGRASDERQPKMSAAGEAIGPGDHDRLGTVPSDVDADVGVTRGANIRPTLQSPGLPPLWPALEAGLDAPPRRGLATGSSSFWFRR